MFKIGAREQLRDLKPSKVTMSTIGYGNEQVPKTILGKIVTVKCAIFGIICMGRLPTVSAPDPLCSRLLIFTLFFSFTDTIHSSLMAKTLYHSDA